MGKLVFERILRAREAKQGSLGNITPPTVTPAPTPASPTPPDPANPNKPRRGFGIRI